MSDSPQMPRSGEENGHNLSSSSARQTHDELAQAFRDLARGEQAATALEANLTNLEQRLDQLLDAIEGQAQPRGDAKREAPADSRTNGNGSDTAS